LRHSARIWWRSLRKKTRAAARQAGARKGLLLDEGGRQRGRQRTGIDALATALKLASKDGSGWEMLGELASDENRRRLSGSPEHRLLAGPARNSSRTTWKKLVTATKTDLGDWGFHRRREHRGACRRASEFAGDREDRMIFVRVMPDTAPKREPGFHAYRHPSGKVGFVSAEGDQPARLRPALLRQGCGGRLGRSWA